MTTSEYSMSPRRESQWLIHLAATVYERVAPPLPRDGQAKDKRHSYEGDPGKVAFVYPSGHD